MDSKAASEEGGLAGDGQDSERDSTTHNHKNSCSPVTSHQIEDILTSPHLQLQFNNSCSSSSRPYAEEILKPIAGKKMPFFINCVIEEKEDGLKHGQTGVFVEIVSTTLFHNFIEAVLSQLGFGREDMLNAKGDLLLNNWKALPLSELTNDSSKTIYDIFSQISDVPTIRIVLRDCKIKRLPGISNLVSTNDEGAPSRGNEEVRDRVMSLLLEQYYKDAAERLKNSLIGPPLKTIQEPLDLGLQSFRSEAGHASNNDDNNNSNKMSSLLGNYGLISPSPPGFQIRPGIIKTREDLLRWQKNYFDCLVSNTGGESMSDAELMRPSSFLTGCSKEEVPIRTSFMNNKTPENFTTNRPRMRVCFDPETEIPRLQKWFAANNHPTRQQVEEFVKELNSLDCRKGRKSLDVNNVIYWFKNTRAAVKRAEMKSKQCSPPRPPPMFPPVSSSSPFLDLRSPPSSNSGIHWPWLNTLKNNSEEGKGAVEWTNKAAKESVVMEAESSTKDSSGIEDGRRSDEELDEEQEECGELTAKEKSLSSPPTRDCESPGLKEDEFRPSLVYPPPPRAPPNPLLSHSVIYMSQYMNPYLQTSNGSSFGIDSEKRKRNRTFIDPVSEVPRLEEWFLHNTHPSHSMIARYTDELNRLPYRQKFPCLEQKNIQFWFKNRRAKCKRMNSCI